MNSCEEQSQTQQPINPHSDQLQNEGEAMESQEEAKSHKTGLSGGAQLEQFLKALESETGIDAKIQMALEYMESSISQAASQQLKNFWEVRKSCLDYFKDESLTPASRVKFWNKYIELSQESRRLKEILDEQSAFATEQIEIAIAALEKDLQEMAERLTATPDTPFSVACSTIESKIDFYAPIQKELNLLNFYASRINALRKELIKTDMRIRQKNKFFQRLSQAGDLVFPRRKDLIKEISQHFIDDVDGFINAHIKEGMIPHALFEVREEIKALQGVAKLLTLNTLAFTHTRMRLSESWDRIKHLEKERKKERAQQKSEFKENEEQILRQISDLKALFDENKLSLSEGYDRLNEVAGQMRAINLGRDEIMTLREAINEIRQALNEKSRAEEDAKQALEVEKDRMRVSRIKEIRAQIDSLFTRAGELNAEDLTLQKEAVQQEIQSSQLSKSEKLELEKAMKPLKDLIVDKRQSSLSVDDKQAIQQLKSLLEERLIRREEIYAQLEVYRKANGGSGLDFQKAFEVQNQIKSEKQTLEKMDEHIRELKTKLRSLEKK